MIFIFRTVDCYIIFPWGPGKNCKGSTIFYWHIYLEDIWTVNGSLTNLMLPWFWKVQSLPYLYLSFIQLSWHQYYGDINGVGKRLSVNCDNAANVGIINKGMSKDHLSWSLVGNECGLTKYNLVIKAKHIHQELITLSSISIEQILMSSATSRTDANKMLQMLLWRTVWIIYGVLHCQQILWQPIRWTFSVCLLF